MGGRVEHAVAGRGPNGPPTVADRTPTRTPLAPRVDAVTPAAPVPDLDDPVDRTAALARWTPWVVAALGFLYYLTPLAASIARGRPLPALLVAELVGAGVLAILALGWRASNPWGVTMAMVVLWAIAPTVIGAALVAQENLARRHRSRSVAVVLAVLLGAAKVVESVRSGFDPARSAFQVELILAGTGIVTATLVGLLRRSRAESAENARQAERARADAVASRISEARAAERERIAREMHDVVAHRISLIALHAGGLAYRSNVTVEEARDAARLIQTNAKASLDELRAMLATLRDADTPPEPPQPTLAELDVLVADATDAGQRVTLTTRGVLADLPNRLSRHAFRVAQECLTNARKHAPGVPVTLSVDVTDAAFTVRASNPLADLATPDRSGAGLGLVGVDERVALVGGTVRHGVHGGEFVVEATFPLGPTRGDA